jgi:hypothetical protein
MPFLFYLPLIIWSGLIGAAQSDAAKKSPRR